MMKKINIFTFMMMIATFALAFRVIDISNVSISHSVAESTAAPQKFEQVPSEQPPQQPPAAAPGAAPAPAAVPAAASPASPADSVPPPASSMYGERAYSAAELDVLQSLSKRRDELEKREQKIGQHEALLKAAEGEVDRKIAELNKIKGELVELLNKQQTVQAERINSLVKIYEGMKPKEAARIFDTLEMDVLLAVISKMSERKSSPILAVMDPEKARIVTIKLSEQHQLPELPATPAKTKSPAAPSPAAVPPVTPAPTPAATQ